MSKLSWSRRNFLKFLGASGSLASLGACGSLKKSKALGKTLPLSTQTDSVTLVSGLNYKVLIKEGDSLGKNLTFGTNNDYLNFYTFPNGKTALWSNHESLTPYLLHNRDHYKAPSLAQLKNERRQLGGSFFEIAKTDKGWKVISNSSLNFGVRGDTPIRLTKKINGEETALGTLANCSGGYTPWGTILTCEENYHHFYGERDFNGDGKSILRSSHDFKWLDVAPKPTEHYGWVVEINPKTKKAKKLVSLGRFAHECATVGLTKKGFPVVYSGDDTVNQCLYKFVSDKKDSLESGTLYVAQLETGKWLPLDVNKNKKLKAKFKTQEELLIRCRDACKVVGATPLDRPEDIEIDPITGDVFITLTNNKEKKERNYHGSILKISEKNKSDLTFRHTTFKSGGHKNGFSCPDNLAFDKNGNLWMTSDISGSSIGKGPYKDFGNNGLFLIPRSGPYAGEVLKVASAPNDAEFTGPFFSPDQKTLFLAVQHPGERSRPGKEYTSHWPSGKKGAKPLSAIITIEGPFLESFTQKQGV